MKLQQLYSYVRQAIDDYQMIADGDQIAVGISGGKDSLTLLYALSGLRRFYPKKFELAALTVDLGFDHYDLSEIRQLCKTLDVEYHVINWRNCFSRTKRKFSMRAMCKNAKRRIK